MKKIGKTDSCGSHVWNNGGPFLQSNWSRDIVKIRVKRVDVVVGINGTVEWVAHGSENIRSIKLTSDKPSINRDNLPRVRVSITHDPAVNRGSSASLISSIWRNTVQPGVSRHHEKVKRHSSRRALRQKKVMWPAASYEINCISGNCISKMQYCNVTRTTIRSLKRSWVVQLANTLWEINGQQWVGRVPYNSVGSGINWKERKKIKLIGAIKLLNCFLTVCGKLVKNEESSPLFLQQVPLSLFVEPWCHINSESGSSSSLTILYFHAC